MIRFLLDQGLPVSAVSALEVRGIAAAHVGRLGTDECPGVTARLVPEPTFAGAGDWQRSHLKRQRTGNLSQTTTARCGASMPDVSHACL